MNSQSFALGLVFVLMTLLGLVMASTAVDSGFAFAGYVFTIAGVLLCYRLIAKGG